MAGDLGTVVRSSVPGVVSTHTTQEHFRNGLGVGAQRRNVMAVPYSPHSAEQTWATF